MFRVFQLWAYLCCSSVIVCVLKHFPFLPLTIFGVSSEELLDCLIFIESEELFSRKLLIFIGWHCTNGSRQSRENFCLFSRRDLLTLSLSIGQSIFLSVNDPRQASF
jgi:hypothetical protein